MLVPSCSRFLGGLLRRAQGTAGPNQDQDDSRRGSVRTNMLNRVMIDPSTGEVFSFNRQGQAWRAIYNVGFHSRLPTERPGGLEREVRRHLQRSPFSRASRRRHRRFGDYEELLFRNLRDWEFVRRGVSEGEHMAGFDCEARFTSKSASRSSATSTCSTPGGSARSRPLRTRAPRTRSSARARSWRWGSWRPKDGKVFG